MTKKDFYQDQVKLLLDVLPVIQKDSRFALKGGTAINLFYRDMPRLSVDIDLTYLPIEPRDVFLDNLSSAMLKFAEELKSLGLIVDEKRVGQHVIKLIVSDDKVGIKVEPNTILRGTVFKPIEKSLSESTENIFLQSQKMKVLAFEDLFAGKICAALDRQHPRDLFDIRLLLDNEGFTPELRKAFIIYLASSPRPMSELLLPNELDLEQKYHEEFIDMTEYEISYESLLDTRKELINLVHTSIEPEEKEFLISLKQGEPDWQLLSLPNISALPSIKWKLQNIQKMSEVKKQAALAKLREVLKA